jgi:heat shock protein HtpX
MAAARDPLPRDRGLVVRMVATAVLTPALVLGALAAVVLLADWKVIAAVTAASVIGVRAAYEERRHRLAPVEVTPEEAPQLHARLERLCTLADLPKPVLVVEPERQPNSWVRGVGRGRSSLHLTEGLLDRLEPAELEAVMAHELAHIAQRDAAVMTVVGGPPAVLLRGARRTGGILWMGAIFAIGIGWLGSLGATVLSRYRELSADAFAARLTGSPAALASALMKVSDSLARIPERDLRVAAARDAFHLLPVSDRRRRQLGLPATHPPLRVRIARLERLERRLHHG